MQKQNKNESAFSPKKRLYMIIAVLCLAAVLIPLGGVLAKYISTQTAEGNVTAALFYTDGDYVEEIKSDSDTAPTINVSGWKDGIVLKLYNYVGENISKVDLSYTCTVSEGWTASAPVTLLKDNKQETTIKLTPAADAKQDDRVEFSLTTAPYAVTMKATFVLSDANIPDWTVEDKGAYALLTIHTNDYTGDITVNYSGTIFAPDSTNPLMAGWNRADGDGSFAAERFTTYELMLFEEEPGTYTFDPSNGKGSNISITTNNGKEEQQNYED